MFTLMILDHEDHVIVHKQRFDSLTEVYDYLVADLPYEIDCKFTCRLYYNLTDVTKFYVVIQNLYEDDPINWYFEIMTTFLNDIHRHFNFDFTCPF